MAIAITCLDELTPEEMAAIPVRYADGRNNSWRDEPREMAYL